MATKRAPKKQPFDVDAYIREQNEAIRKSGLTEAQLDGIHQQGLSDPDMKESIAEADALYEQIRARMNAKSAVHRRTNAARKRSA